MGQFKVKFILCRLTKKLPIYQICYAGQHEFDLNLFIFNPNI